MSAWIRVGGIACCLVALLAPAAPAADEEEVRKAIDAGVAYLKGLQQGGIWQYDPGRQSTPLVALTLLECEVDSSDPVIQRAAAAVRDSSLTEYYTYSIALDILFLDRLGDPKDEPLIVALAHRLIKGQTNAGGWGYSCPVDVNEVHRLRNKAKTEEAKEEKKEAPDEPRGQGNFQRPMQPPFGQVPQPPPVPFGAATGDPIRPEGDNSNTQFAIIGLWVARRHKAPVERALNLVERRFRNGQNGDGGWGYLILNRLPRGAFVTGTTPAMTCAGLLGLAIAHGLAEDATLRSEERGRKGGGRAGTRASGPPREPSRDPNVTAGLVYLGRMMGGPYRQAAQGAAGPPLNVGIGAGVVPPRAGVQFQGPPRGMGNQPGRDDTDYYGLWSIERVAMALGLKTINKINWYDWGTSILVARQTNNGSWAGRYGSGGVDTCFALLFLQRSNLAADLTTKLKGRVFDPAEVKLRAGGVGGEGLLGKENADPEPKPRSSKKGKKETPETGNIPELAEPGRRPGGAGSGDKPARATEPDDPDADAARLGTQLVKAPAGRQDAVLDKLRERKGSAYTQALASAIPHLKGEAKGKAREALAERLSRMTTPTLRDKFGDEDLEIRRAAALAAAVKQDKSFVPDLIKLLGDEEPPVTRAAHAALKELTEQDFGPGADASRAERAQALTAWKEWWAKQKDK